MINKIIAAHQSILLSAKKTYALVSSGTQWIDEGIVYSTEIDIETTFSAIGGSNKRVFGAGSASEVGLWLGSDSNMYFKWNTGNVGTVMGSYDLDTYYTFKKVGGDLYLNDTLAGSVTGQADPVSEVSTALFARKTDDTPTVDNLASIRLSSRKVWEDATRTTLLRDMVAVPSGNTTYSSTPAPSNCLWDKVSEQYFENQESGSFDIEVI